MTNKPSDHIDVDGDDIPFDESPTLPFIKLRKEKDVQPAEVDVATPMFTEGGTQIVPVYRPNLDLPLEAVRLDNPRLAPRNERNTGVIDKVVDTARPGVRNVLVGVAPERKDQEKLQSLEIPQGTWIKLVQVQLNAEGNFDKPLGKEAEGRVLSEEGLSYHKNVNPNIDPNAKAIPTVGYSLCLDKSQRGDESSTLAVAQIGRIYEIIKKSRKKSTNNADKSNDIIYIKTENGSIYMLTYPK